MMQKNMFRLGTLIAAIVVTSIVIAFFTYPFVQVNSQEVADYQAATHNHKENVEYMTGYETVLYYLHAKPRSDIDYY